MSRRRALYLRLGVVILALVLIVGGAAASSSTAGWLTPILVIVGVVLFVGLLLLNWIMRVLRLGGITGSTSPHWSEGEGKDR